MGLILSKLYEVFESTFSEDSPAKIVMLGLDNAGKTTILYKLKLNETVTSIPTIGFNVETVTPYKGVSFTVWDVGGQNKIRHLWNHYYNGCEGLIYVVDSTDQTRFAEAKEELFGILNSEEMSRKVPVVVLANKQDLPGAVKTSSVADALNLSSLKTRKWFVQGTCGLYGEGIYEAVNELGRLVKEYKRNNT